MTTRRPAAYAAEFLGTFLLVLFIGLILASNSAAGLGSTDFAVVGLLHVGTFALMWAIMGTAVDPRSERTWAPWVIGATLGLAVMTVGPFTGAGLNPARAFGPALVSGAFGGAGTFVLVYVVAPVAGAALTAAGYARVVLEPRDPTPATRQVDALERSLERVALPD